MKCIVADSGPLIALAGVELLHLPSSLFETAFITETVLAESLGDARRPGNESIRDAVAEGLFQVVPDPPIPATLIDAALDPGELTALAHAAEHQMAVLLDEERGRRKAQQLAIPVIGFCGVLLLAKRESLITAVSPVLRRARENGYYLGADLIRQIEALANE